MIDFLVKSTVSLGILYLFYILFLRSLKTFKFNRYFLLGSLFFCLAVPLISLPIDFDITTASGSDETLKKISSTIVQLDENIFIPLNKRAFVYLLLPYLYAFVTFILFSRFSYNLFNIIRTIRGNQIIHKSTHWLVLDKNCKIPYTFFNHIIVNTDDCKKGNIDHRLMQHEITHARQMHSVDIVIVELFKVFMWMNPFGWVLKKSMRLNHEYLADNSVLSKNSISEYQNVLINLVLCNNTGALTSNFNFSVTKQRLTMMTKNFSRKTAIFGYLASVIVIAFLGATLAFSQKTIGFKIKVDGARGNYAKKELKLSNFGMMEITTNYKDFEVSTFEITLARGLRPIYIDKVSGNQFDLDKYSKTVRDGDRILIQILEVTPSLNEGVEFPEDRGIELSDRNIELTSEKSIISIPIGFDK